MFAKPQFVFIPWNPKKFHVNTLEYYLEPEGIIPPGIHYAVNVKNQDEDLPQIIKVVEEVLSDPYSSFAGFKNSRGLLPIAHLIKPILRTQAEELCNNKINPIVCKAGYGPAIWGNYVVHSSLNLINELVAVRTAQRNIKQAIMVAKKIDGYDELVYDDFFHARLNNFLEEIRGQMMMSKLSPDLQYLLAGMPPAIDVSINSMLSATAHRFRWYVGLNMPREFSDLEEIFG